MHIWIEFMISLSVIYFYELVKAGWQSQDRSIDNGSDWMIFKSEIFVWTLYLNIWKLINM